MRFVRRKWGFYITLLDRKHFKVKFLKFKKHHECSLQYHKKRNELWLFLSGKGVMTTFLESYKPKLITPRNVSAGDYEYIFLTQKHQYYANDSTWVLEIQFGSRCSEDDIVRL